MKNKTSALTAIACAIAIFAFLPALTGASHLEEAMLPELDQLNTGRSGGDFRQGRGPQTALASLTLPTISGSVDEPGRNRAQAAGFAGGGLSDTGNLPPPIPIPSTGLGTVAPGGNPNAPPPSVGELTTAELQAGIQSAPGDQRVLGDIGLGVINPVVQRAANDQRSELGRRAVGSLPTPSRASGEPEAFGLDRTGNADFSRGGDRSTDNRSNPRGGTTGFGDRGA